MKSFKLILRILISIIIGIPTLPILYAMFTIFGIGLIISIAGIIGYICNWLINNNNQKDNIELIQMSKYMFIAPFLFWYQFIIGNNPMKLLS